MLTADALRAQFIEAYGKNHGEGPRVFSAPGRVNLIGEHTDYNDGFVLPMAIDRRTYVVAAPRKDRVIRAISTSEMDPVEFPIRDELSAGSQQTNGRTNGRTDGWADGRANNWGSYVYGMAECLRREKVDLRGANLLIASEVPIGAGLSSSAALEVSTGFGLLNIAHQSMKLTDLALTAQRAEQQFAGTQCGVMDQYIACLGIEGHALLVDCRSLEYRAVPIDLANARVVICNTMVKHDLASGEYNQRRAECEEGVRILSRFLPDIMALRDVDVDDFNLYAGALPEPVRRRCNHVITENARTLAAVQALENGDLNLFGKLMYASHDSLRADYEVSCRELDLLVELASRCDGVFGARMTGGGFGGCTVNLVASDAVENFIAKIGREYETEIGVNPDCYVCQASTGVMEVAITGE